jgi:hypothetical protein
VSSNPHNICARVRGVMRWRQWATVLLLALFTTTGRVYAQPSCARPTHSLAGFTADLQMRSRQVRGTVTVVDACSFEVTQLEVRLLFISSITHPATAGLRQLGN